MRKKLTLSLALFTLCLVLPAQVAGSEDGFVVMRLGSGKYRFENGASGKGNDEIKNPVVRLRLVTED
ncbi:MAG: hypothetical protein IH592_13910 [Bacteroidales bacterium]|nr:hypothetical protein [Bacteroidales bacterium]